MAMRLGWIIVLVLTFSRSVLAADWPQFLGPNRDGSYPERVSVSWPANGPKTIWKTEVGEGFAGPVVAAGKLILFHRTNNQEQISCFDAATGKSIWRHAYPASYRDDFGFDEGPRSTPAIAGNHVFTMGAEGTITCLDLREGTPLWQVSAREEFGAEKGFFGMACSPLVEDGLVLLNIGGKNGAGIVALEGATGKARWKATGHEASYSSPVAATIGGTRHAFFFTREGLVVLEPSNGKVTAQFPWRSRAHASVNAATPLVLGNQIFLSASYDTGAVLLEFNPPELRKIWSEESSLSSHYASVVHHGGALFGFDGRQEYGPDLVCVDWKSGQVLWREDSFGAGTITLAKDQLLILRETGELIVAAASREQFRILAQAQILGATRAYPALAHGRLYARDKNRLVCFDFQ